jgi:hypothetical protein
MLLQRRCSAWMPQLLNSTQVYSEWKNDEIEPARQNFEYSPQGSHNTVTFPVDNSDIRLHRNMEHRLTGKETRYHESWLKIACWRRVEGEILLNSLNSFVPLKGSHISWVLTPFHNFGIFKTPTHDTLRDLLGCVPCATPIFFHVDCRFFANFCCQKLKTSFWQHIDDGDSKTSSNNSHFLDETEIFIIWVTASPATVKHEYVRWFVEDVAHRSRIKQM